MSQPDYVLATKWSDGDSNDHWCVGFCTGMTDHDPPRYDIVDSDGKLFRGNGFRKVEPITKEEGNYILERKEFIQLSARTLWWHLEQYYKNIPYFMKNHEIP